jgi:hypothetical protein
MAHFSSPRAMHSSFEPALENDNPLTVEMELYFRSYSTPTISTHYQHAPFCIDVRWEVRLNFSSLYFIFVVAPCLATLLTFRPTPADCQGDLSTTKDLTSKNCLGNLKENGNLLLS